MARTRERQRQFARAHWGERRVPLLITQYEYTSDTNERTMPELSEDNAARVVNRVSDLLPGIDLLLVPDPRRVLPLCTLLSDLYTLRDNQTRAALGALFVVFHVDRIGDVRRDGPITRQGRHENTVLERERPQLEWLEKRSDVGHGDE